MTLLVAPLAGWLAAFLVVTAAHHAHIDLAWRVEPHLLLAAALAALSIPTLYAGHLLSKLVRRAPAGCTWYLIAALTGPAAVTAIMNLHWATNVRYGGFIAVPFLPAYAAAITSGLVTCWLLKAPTRQKAG